MPMTIRGMKTRLRSRTCCSRKKARTEPRMVKPAAASHLQPSRQPMQIPAMARKVSLSTRARVRGSGNPSPRAMAAIMRRMTVPVILAVHLSIFSTNIATVYNRTAYPARLEHAERFPWVKPSQAALLARVYVSKICGILR